MCSLCLREFSLCLGLVSLREGLGPLFDDLVVVGYGRPDLLRPGAQVPEPRQVDVPAGLHGRVSDVQVDVGHRHGGGLGREAGRSKGGMMNCTALLEFRVRKDEILSIARDYVVPTIFVFPPGKILTSPSSKASHKVFSSDSFFLFSVS